MLVRTPQRNYFEELERLSSTLSHHDILYMSSIVSNRAARVYAKALQYRLLNSRHDNIRLRSLSQVGHLSASHRIVVCYQSKNVL